MLYLFFPSSTCTVLYRNYLVKSCVFLCLSVTHTHTHTHTSTLYVYVHYDCIRTILHYHLVDVVRLHIFRHHFCDLLFIAHISLDEIWYKVNRTVITCRRRLPSPQLSTNPTVYYCTAVLSIRLSCCYSINKL